MHDEGFGEPAVWRTRRVQRRYRLALLLLTFVTTLVTVRCSERSQSVRSATPSWWRSGQPDEPPRMLNASPPFPYPVAQYLSRTQGNVTLWLFVDAEGRVVTDSTRIERSSGISAFDSAALAGARELRFRPAQRRGTAVPVAVLFPVHFRHPEGPKFPGDSSPDSIQ